MHNYSEDTLIEQPAIALFARLGYETVNAFHEQAGAGSVLGREMFQEVVLDWRKKQQAIAQVRLAVQQVLDSGLPASYSPTLYERTCEEVYQHVFDSYTGAGRSIYTAA